MYIAPGQGQTTPRGQSFDVNRNVLSLHSFVASFKKVSLKSDLIHFFFVIVDMYIAPGQGQTTPRGQSFDVNRNVLSLHSFIVSFKKVSLKSDFIQFFFMIVYMYIAPGQGQITPRGLNVNRKALSLYPFVASFKEFSLEYDFIQFFFMI